MPIVLEETGRSDSVSEVSQVPQGLDMISSVALKKLFCGQHPFTCKVSDASAQRCRKAVSNTCRSGAYTIFE